MNRKHLIPLLLLSLVAVLGSCNGSSQVYGNQLQAEKKLIADYIKRNNINIIKVEPINEEWGENDYLEIDDYLYFHLVNAGDIDGEPLAYRDYISLRYRKYTLNEYADTISAWTTNDAPSPIEFQIGITSSATCEAWLQAVGYMKYNNAECKIICPSKLGFTDDANSVTPYGYDLKIKVRK